MRIMFDNSDGLSKVVDVDCVNQTRTIRVISKADTTDYYTVKEDKHVAVACHSIGDDAYLYVVMHIRDANVCLREALMSGFVDFTDYAETTFISPAYNTPNLLAHFNPCKAYL